MRKPLQTPEVCLPQARLARIETLRAAPSNARTHSKKQLRQLADSIREFGFTNPVLVDAKGEVIAGHGRLAAARMLGLAEVPTGRGGNLVIIDDPLKPEDALSEARREAVNGWYSRTLLSRLNNKVRDAIILVQQRLHLDDLAGHVEGLDDWVTLRLPAIAEEDAHIPIGPGQAHLRRAGDVLHPEREPREVLDALRRALGSATFSAQYQQCPVPSDGEIVKWGWFRRFAEPPPLQHMGICQSWDTASKPDEHCDYSVCTTWGIRGDDLFLLDVDRARLDFPSLKRRVIELARRWQPRTLLVEDKGSGTALIQQLRAEPNGIAYPTAFVPRDDKLTRLHAQSAWIEAGHIWLPEHAPWLEDLRTEIASFPQGRHDDQVDSISQFLAWHFSRKGKGVQMIRLGGV